MKWYSGRLLVPFGEVIEYSYPHKYSDYFEFNIKNGTIISFKKVKGEELFNLKESSSK
jgi:hypothetical protein